MTASDAAPRPQVFIQTNAKQLIGALVSAHSLKRNSAHGDAFDVTRETQQTEKLHARHKSSLHSDRR